MRLLRPKGICAHQTGVPVKLCYAESSLPLGSAVLKVLALGIPADDSELPATQHHWRSMLRLAGQCVCASIDVVEVCPVGTLMHVGTLTRNWID